MANDRTSGVYPLDELDDLKVADDDIDPRGWAVYSQDGQQLGEVKDLLVDVAAMKVRYLDVELGRDVAGPDRDDRHVLFPVGTARLDDSDDRVFVNAAAASVAALPAYRRGGPVTRDYENTLRRGFVTAAGTTAGTDAAPGEVTAAELDYYNHDHYDTDRFYGGRTSRGAAAGQQRAAASDDAAPADRQPLAASAAPAEQRAGEIRMPVNAEEVVVAKRPVVREEIVIRKRAVIVNQTVETDVRRERVEVDSNVSAGPSSVGGESSAPGTYGTGGTMGDVDTTPHGGLGDAARRGAGRAANAVDDLKDRVDGNPASRPGPDATDRRP